MDVVYLFCDDKSMRIPLCEYDYQIFNQLKNCGTGYWDHQTSQFILKSDYINSADLAPLFRNIPYVEIRPGAVPPVLVHNFFKESVESGGRPAFGVKASPAVRSPAEALPAALPAVKAPPMLIKPSSVVNTPAVVNAEDHRCLAASVTLPELFSPSWQEKLETELRSRKYSITTIKSYLYYNRVFCRNIQKKPEDVRTEDVKGYLAHLDKMLDLSSSSMNLAISALKFFYTNILKKDVAQEQSRPRQDKRLPVVFSGAEINQILNIEKNPKHRLLLMLAYSSGLRVSEVVALKKADIDFARKTILIRAGKGRKDRYTLLSDRAARFIADYCSLHRINNWLFPGQSSTHLSIRSAQSIFEKAIQKAGISKTVSIHSLRHTFATHLLENGTDIKYIQSLLGHVSLRTTQRYTHIARRHVLKIQSPLDTIVPDAD
jgi:site-specific recombinase XerD